MSDARSGTPFRPWDAFALWVLVFLVAGFAYSAFCDEACAEGTAPEVRTIAGLMLLPVLFGAGVWLWARLVRGVGLEAIGLRRPTWAAVGIGIGYGLGGRLLAAVTEAATLQIAEMIRGAPPELPQQIGIPERPSTVFWVGIAIAVVALAPITEEMLFRGLAYVGLRDRVGVMPAVIITSLFFAVTHIEPLIMPALFVLAIVLARLREARDDLVPPIVAHATFNLVGFIALFVQHVV